jgi:ABC-2 type transport system ATP-binding protein
MIETRQISKRYGRRLVVDAVDLRVEPGQTLALLGPGGAGKSTLLRMLAGFLLPDGGHAVVGGHDVVRASMAARSRLGYLPQGAPTYDEMRARDFLRFVASIRGLRGIDRDRGLNAVVERCELDDVLERPMGTLDADSRRRVGLAQAIVHDPPVLLLDEPCVGLDALQQARLRRIVRGFAAGRSVIVASGGLEDARALCGRVAVIVGGRLCADATLAQLMARSRYHGAVSFSATHAAVARQALARLPGVLAVETAAADGRTTVFAAPGATILGEVQRTLHALEVDCGEIQLERGRLDDVFAGLVAAAEARERAA